MSERYFPFHRLGFRGNPFRTLSDQEWVAVAVLPAAVTATLEQGFAHLQLLGQKGCGKTTTLLALAGYFERSGRRVVYEYIPEGQHHFEIKARPLDLLAIDEAQRLSAGERRRLLALPPETQLMISSHADLTRYFERVGLALTTVQLDGLEDGPAAEHLGQVMNRRLDFFSLARPPALRLSVEAAAYLAHEFGPNLRAAELFLYEFFQQLAAEPQPASRLIDAAWLRRFRATPAGRQEYLPGG